MLSYQYGKSHCGDKTILRSSYLHNGISSTGKTIRSSYLHNGISHTGKTISFYWIRAIVTLTDWYHPWIRVMPPNKFVYIPIGMTPLTKKTALAWLPLHPRKKFVWKVFIKIYFHIDDPICEETTSIDGFAQKYSNARSVFISWHHSILYVALWG